MLSRLDKVFANLPDSDLQLSTLQCGVLWAAEYDQKGSDHVAIRFSISSGSRPPPQPCPRWIVEHPLFRPYLEDLLTEFDVGANDAFTLEDYKDCCRGAVRNTRRLQQHSVATSKLEKRHWAALALRGALAGDWCVVEGALPRWLPLQRAFDRHGRGEAFVQSLRSMVRTLNQAEIDSDIENIEEEARAYT